MSEISEYKKCQKSLVDWYSYRVSSREMWTPRKRKESRKYVVNNEIILWQLWDKNAQEPTTSQKLRFGTTFLLTQKQKTACWCQQQVL